MTRRTPARLLAPLALVTVAAALFIVVSNGLDGGTGGDASTPASRATDAEPTRAAEGATTSASGRRRGRRTYTVRAGDTPSGIAQETGVSVEELLELNPDLDAQSLSVGQRLKLR
jgi:LysM repeat protein